MEKIKQKIAKLYLEDIENENHPSNFIIEKDYIVLILRIPQFKEDQVFFTSFAFVIINTSNIYCFNRKRNEFIKLDNFYSLYKILDEEVDELLNLSINYQNFILQIENELYEDEIQEKFINEWLIQKKELSQIESIVSNLIIIFEKFLKYFKNLESFPVAEFNDIKEHIQRAYRFTKNSSEKLDHLYNFYNARMSEKLNKNMYLLTIISCIILPLTLITGYFGMNTGGLPFSNDIHGTYKVTVYSIIFEIILIVLLIYFRVSKKKKREIKRKFKSYKISN